MLVVFGEVKEFKEHLVECKRCKKEYPSNNFIVSIGYHYHSLNCKNCREDLRKEGVRRKVMQARYNFYIF